MDNKEQARFFNETMAQHSGIFHKVARAYCPDEGDRQDLLQEIRVQVWRALPKYDNRYKMSTFLYRIALNVAISFWRKHARRAARYTPIDEQAHQLPSENSPDSEWQFALLEQFISELKETDKALLVLYLDDNSHAAIADITGLSASNVGTRIGRIKEKLKIRFSQHKHNEND